MDRHPQVTLHNRFDIRVLDAKTGQVKQKATAFNVILNQYFTDLASYANIYNSTYNYMKGCAVFGTQADLLTSLAYGKGNGTPAVTDTAMFSSLGSISFTNKVRTYGPICSYSATATIDENTSNGQQITEVGIIRNITTYFSFSSPNNVTRLISHAMLQDSEGNQIAINKTSTDIIVITATVYLTVTNAGFGTGAIYPNTADNLLTQFMFNVIDGSSGNFLNQLVHFSNILPKNAKEFDKLSSGNFTATCNGGANGVFTGVPIALGSTSYDKKSIRCIGLPGLGLTTFPNHDIFPPYEVNGMALGTGDGTNKDFNISAPYIMAGSEIITVDGVPQTRNVDYTIDYEANPYDQHECYHTAKMRMGEGVSFGTVVPNSTGPYGDPCLFGRVLNVSALSTPITQASPILIDFGEAKSSNRLRIEIASLTTVILNAITIEYSTNFGATWTTAPNLTRSGQVWTFDLTTAQMWRVYAAGQTWTYSFYSGKGSSIDGTPVLASFYLGKTVPGLRFVNAPAAGKAVQASYRIDIPYKTSNNSLTYSWAFAISRG